MKKWKKVLIIIFSIILFLILTAYGIYKLYVEPKIVDPALLKIQEVLNDEDVQKAVDDFVNEMLESGYLTEADIPEYMEYREQIIPASPGTQPDGQPNPQPGAQPGDPSATGNPDASQSADVPAMTDNTPAQTPPPAPTKQPEKKKKNMTLIERAKAEMTADEFAFSMYIYGKVDVGYVTSNIGTNREEVKAYARRTLSSSEISRSLAIYSKYSYILKN